MRLSKILLSALPLFALAATSFADDAPLKWIDSMKDVQIYLKPKYNLINQWDQEFGIVATVARKGNFSLTPNICYDPLYPIEFNKAPRFSAGLQFTYYLTSLPFKFGVYTKPKYNLVAAWKQETGVTARLYTSPVVFVNANLAYVYNYPYIAGKEPNWLALVSFNFPLGR